MSVHSGVSSLCVKIVSPKHFLSLMVTLMNIDDVQEKTVLGVANGSSNKDNLPPLFTLFEN